MKKIVPVLSLAALSGCNTVAIKPHTLDITQPIYVDTNGEQMRFYLKQELEKRGYNVTVGQRSDTQRLTMSVNGDNEGLVATSTLNGARYVATVNEYDVWEYMRYIGRPLCIFNGWKWVDFNVSIADNKTGKEILYWSGMGCKNYVQRELSEILDKMEKQVRN